MDLWLIRHPRPLVEPGICYGHWDVPADPAHTQQVAEQVCRAWSTEGIRPVRLHVSPLQRAHALALAIQSRCDHRPAVIVDNDLAEMNFGDWEGRAWSAIGPQAVDAWVADFWTHRPPGDGESTRDVFHRVVRACDRLARASDGEGAPAIAITHAGVIRAACWIKAHGFPSDLRASDWPRGGPQPGEWVRLAGGFTAPTTQAASPQQKGP